MLIDYSKKAFCRELGSFLNGLAVAGLTPLCVSLVYEQTGTEGLLQAHFNLEVCTQQMEAFHFAFEVCFDQEYKKVVLISSENQSHVCVWAVIKAAGTCLGGSLVKKTLANK